MSDSGELKYLSQLTEELTSQLQWGTPTDWKNSNFLELSNLVKRATKVRISADTLKRVMGKTKTEEAYTPQLATKNALAIYLGYVDWADFKLKHSLPPDEQKGHTATLFALPLWKVAAGIALVVLATFYFFIPKPPASYTFDIQGKYLRGNAYHTAVFEYDVSSVTSTDSIFLSFGDGSPKVRLDKGNTTLSHYYRGPGLYTVNLLIDNQSVYDTSVYLSTTGWEAHTFFWQTDHTEYLPIYQFYDSATHTMRVPHDMARTKGIDTTQMYWVQYANFKDFGIDGDNFELTANLKNDKEIIPARCHHVKINVIGEKQQINLYFLKEGCSKWVNLRFSEVGINGSHHDLSAFGKDFSQYHRVKVHVKDKEASVYYDDKLLYKQRYQQPLGDIKGITFQFSGEGGAVEKPTITALK